MNYKYLLTALTILISTSTQSVDQYTSLTQNFDNVLQADIDELRNAYNDKQNSFYTKHLKNIWLDYVTDDSGPVSLNSIKHPTHKRFVNASHYLSEQLIYGKNSKKEYELATYILKDQLTKILSQNNMICEYRLNLDSYYGKKYFRNLQKIKDDYLDYASDTGFNAKSFIDQDHLQGYIENKKGRNGGLIHVLIKGRVVSLLASDCTKTVSKEQIIKDLTEWAELLINANK